MYKIQFILPFLILSTIIFLQFYSPRLKHNIGELQQYNQVINSSQNDVINSSQNDVINSSQKEDFREQSSLAENLADISTSKMDIIESDTTTLSKY